MKKKPLQYTDVENKKSNNKIHTKNATLPQMYLELRNGPNNFWLL